MKLLNRSSLTLLAKAPFAEWVATLPVDEFGSSDISLGSLQKEGNVYLIGEVESEDDFRREIGQHWRSIFENELTAWDEMGDFWPSDLSLELFHQWFTVGHQLMVFDLTEETLLVAPLDNPSF